MPAGLNAKITREQVDQTTGTTAQAINVAFRDVASTKSFLDVYQDAELEAIGFQPGEIATLRSAYADLDRLRRVFEGLEEVTPAYDFTTFAQRLWGTGFAGY